MDTTMVTGVLREAVGVVIKLGGPMLVLSMAAVSYTHLTLPTTSNV